MASVAPDPREDPLVGTARLLTQTFAPWIMACADGVQVLLEDAEQRLVADGQNERLERVRRVRARLEELRAQFRQADV